MQDPQSFTIASKQRTVATVEQRYYLVNQSDKPAALTRLIEVEPITSALIFARKRIDTNELVNELVMRGFPAEALNGDMSQDAREQVLNHFRDNKIKILVATDVAARGLDIDDISHVFNYDLPESPEVYVHRIGRTGRAGKNGTAITLLAPGESWGLRRIESYVKLKIAPMALPTVEDIEMHRKSRLVDQVLVWLRRGRCRNEREIVAELAGAGHDLMEIAVAALKMARVEKKQRPITAIKPVRESNSPKGRRPAKVKSQRIGRERSAGLREKGMVRLALSTGRANGIRINQIVGTLSRFADIPGASLGKISIQKQRTFVDVPVKHVSRVLANTANYRIGRQTITVKRA
jgi:ATP-dependent RNA helicase DeaD